MNFEIYFFNNTFLSELMHRIFCSLDAFSFGITFLVSKAEENTYRRGEKHSIRVWIKILRTLCIWITPVMHGRVWALLSAFNRVLCKWVSFTANLAITPSLSQCWAQSQCQTHPICCRSLPLQRLFSQLFCISGCPSPSVRLSRSSLHWLSPASPVPTDYSPLILFESSIICIRH